MSTLLKGLFGFFVAILWVTSPVFAREELLVYTAVEPEFLTVYKDAFEKLHPDIDITYVRDSAGPITARLLAEKNNPKADVILGLSAISLEKLRSAGILTP